MNQPESAGAGGANPSGGGFPREISFFARTRVLIGSGTLNRLPTVLPTSRVLLLYGRSAQVHLERIRSLLPECHLCTRAVHTGEPTTETVDDAIRDARRYVPTAILAIGGGSVIDTAKAVAGLVGEDPILSCADFLEIDGVRTLSGSAVPVVAVPTLSGSGAEVTRNAVILNRRTGAKRSLRHDVLFPAAALVDPDLAAGAPRAVRLIAAVDALCHLVESFCSVRATPVTLPLSAEGIRLLCGILPELPDEAPGRFALAVAGTLGGITLTNAGLTFGHSIGAVLGPSAGIPHGAACGLMLPAVLAWCLPHLPPDRRTTLQRFFGNDPAAHVHDLLDRAGFYRTVRARALDDATRTRVITEAAATPSTRGTPGAPDTDALRHALDVSLASVAVQTTEEASC